MTSDLLTVTSVSVPCLLLSLFHIRRIGGGTGAEEVFNLTVVGVG